MSGPPRPVEPAAIRSTSTLSFPIRPETRVPGRGQGVVPGVAGVALSSAERSSFGSAPRGRIGCAAVAGLAG